MKSGDMFRREWIERKFWHHMEFVNFSTEKPFIFGSYLFR